MQFELLADHKRTVPRIEPCHNRLGDIVIRENQQRYPLRLAVFAVNIPLAQAVLEQVLHLCHRFVELVQTRNAPVEIR